MSTKGCRLKKQNQHRVFRQHQDDINNIPSTTE